MSTLETRFLQRVVAAMADYAAARSGATAPPAHLAAALPSPGDEGFEGLTALDILELSQRLDSLFERPSLADAPEKPVGWEAIPPARPEPARTASPAAPPPAARPVPVASPPPRGPRATADTPAASLPRGPRATDGAPATEIPRGPRATDPTPAARPAAVASHPATSSRKLENLEILKKMLGEEKSQVRSPAPPGRPPRS